MVKNQKMIVLAGPRKIRHVSVKRPVIIREYNANMAGVNLCDRMIAFYRMRTCTKKWTIRVILILHFIDLALVNAWIQYRKDKQLLKAPKKEVLQFLNFKLVIAQTYLAAINTERQQCRC